MQVVEVGPEVVVDAGVAPGEVVAFADHGVGVVVASDGRRAWVRPARGAAPQVGDAVTEGARWTSPIRAVSRGHGGVTLGLGGVHWGEDPWWLGSVDAWARWGPVVVELDALAKPPAVAATARVGWEHGWVAAGVEVGGAPPTWSNPARPWSVGAGPWARLGGRDALNVQVRLPIGGEGPLDLDLRAGAPIGRDATLLVDASFPLAEQRGLDRDGVGVATHLRRWGGPGTVRLEGWVWLGQDERSASGDGVSTPLLELRGGYRW